MAGCGTFLKGVVLPASAALLVGFGPGTARADFVGFSVDGACHAGTCPAEAMPLSTSQNVAFAFDVTLGDGDMFRFVGSVSGSNDATGTFVLSNDIFTATYLGGPGGTSAADTLSADGSHAWQVGFSGISGPFGAGLTGFFGPDAAAGSSASLNVSAQGIDSADFGPFVNPADSPFSQSGSYLSDISGGVFDVENVYTLAFAAGTRPGGFIDINGAPVPTPEPATLAILASGFAGVWFTRRRKRV